ncbi:MAG: O-methyltransferase [Candidatus Caccovivens sp.]
MKEKEELVGFADKKYRPIIREHSREILLDLVKEIQPKRVLEIGTFIGYSACAMLEAGAKYVVTIEIDEKNAHDARENLQKYHGQFEVKNCDAMEYLKVAEDKFDLIFLDGAKGQYFKYLPYLKKLMNVGGYLVADDILFYGLVKKEGPVAHKHRTIVVNLRKFIDEIENDSDFETKIYEIENGISISKKKV